MSGIGWLARHELRLAWRDFLWMVTAGRHGRKALAILFLCGFIAVLHGIAWMLVSPFSRATFPPDRQTLIVVTGSAFLAWTMMISQAMESVTRAFYARSDLDLLLSSPAPTRLIFALRTGAIGVGTAALALLLIGPFIDALAFTGGARWLAAYGVLAALAAAAAALAVGFTVLLFWLLGPKRTRFIAQVVAAIVGAAFVIGVQVAAIFGSGSLSRLDAFRSGWILHMAPHSDSVFWLPARAAMGDFQALGLLMIASFALFGGAILLASKQFGAFATAAAGIGREAGTQSSRKVFRRLSTASALRRKEWALLLRDPWLASQTLMQVLYLIPPALLLWRNYAAGAGAATMLVPVLVMAAGQLAGGLAWLAVSGEDAPDLVSTAPLAAKAILRAKIEAVIGAVVLVLGPLILALAFASAQAALITLAGVLIAAASATSIQLLFRAQAKRSQFRRRQTSSRVATVVEAFSSIGWAATAGLAAAGNPLAALPAAATVLIVLLARTIRAAPQAA